MSSVTWLPHSMWECSSLTRDWTLVPCIARRILQPPGKALLYSFLWTKVLKKVFSWKQYMGEEIICQLLGHLVFCQKKKNLLLDRHEQWPISLINTVLRIVPREQTWVQLPSWGATGHLQDEEKKKMRRNVGGCQRKHQLLHTWTGSNHTCSL